jgi:hypothetical protein
MSCEQMAAGWISLEKIEFQSVGGCFDPAEMLVATRDIPSPMSQRTTPAACL